MTHRVAVVGLGGIAQKGHLPVLSTIKDLELMFYSRTAERVADLATQYRIAKATNRLEELFEWQPQSVFILTPTPTHASLAIQFLNKGIDVFMEKPASESSEETRQLAELADQKKCILMLAFNRRFAPLSIKAKEIWGSRKVTLGVFQKNRAKPGFQGLFNHVNEELVHVIDLVRFFCGEAKAIKTTYTLGPDNYMTEVVSLLQLANGGFVNLLASLQAGQWYEHYELNGESATIRLNTFSDLTFISNNEATTWKEPYDSTWNSNLYGRGFVNQIEHFFHCVKTRQQPQTNAWDSVKTQQLMEDILAKAQ